MAHTQGIDPGFAGRSARRESERRRRSRRGRAPHGLLALLEALLGPAAAERRRIAAERAWSAGAQGEELVAQSLAARCPDVPVLHDRRMPGAEANIDHIAVAPSGVYVIDTKRYKGRIEVSTPAFGSPKLKIAGRDRTKLIDRLERQVAAVQHELDDIAPGAALHGCLCFVAPEGLLEDVGLPLMKTLKLRGYPLYHVRMLATRLNGPGPLTTAETLTISTALADRLPPA